MTRWMTNFSGSYTSALRTTSPLQQAWHPLLLDMLVWVNRYYHIWICSKCFERFIWDHVNIFLRIFNWTELFWWPDVHLPSSICIQVFIFFSRTWPISTKLSMSKYHWIKWIQVYLNEDPCFFSNGRTKLCTNHCWLKGLSGEA